MHGLGNDFVVIDNRQHHFALTSDGARRLAHRHTGIGCDQVIEIEEPGDRAEADIFMRIWNADGSEVDACGNATRCVASLLMAEGARQSLTIATGAGLLAAEAKADGLVAVDMGKPRLDWRDVPLSQAGSQAEDTLHLDLSEGPLSDPVAVSMGNPHCVFFVADAEAIDIERHGPLLEHHPLFPERANIGVAQVIDRGTIRLRVWERGAGLTLACGTGACAAAVAAARRGLTGRSVEMRLDGGILNIDWRENDHVTMTGPAAVSYTGIFDDSLVEG
jgi:diaminopimelate epimerase